MTRLACFLGLIALTVLGIFLRHVDGTTAILFSFIGMPTLGLALLVHLIHRWRVGAFALTLPPSPKQSR